MYAVCRQNNNDNKGENKLEKITEKMGLYDIWTILFPGAIFLVLVKTVYNFMLTLPCIISKEMSIIEKVFVFCKAEVYIPDTAYELLIMCLCSYLAGLILHEISRLIKDRVIYKKGKPTDFLLDSENGVFSKGEIQKLMPMYTYLYGSPFCLDEKEKLKNESHFIFQRINNRLQRNKIASQYVKLNIVYNTCAVLQVTIILVLCMAILFEVEFIISKNYDILLSAVSLDIFMIICICLLSNRSKKFYKYWVRNIVLAYQDIYLNDKCDAED